MVPGSRNPMWGEEFNFSVDELPVQVAGLSSMLCFCSYNQHFTVSENGSVIFEVQFPDCDVEADFPLSEEITL